VQLQAPGAMVLASVVEISDGIEKAYLCISSPVDFTALLREVSPHESVFDELGGYKVNDKLLLEKLQEMNEPDCMRVLGSLAAKTAELIPENMNLERGDECQSKQNQEGVNRFLNFEHDEGCDFYYIGVPEGFALSFDGGKIDCYSYTVGNIETFITHTTAQRTDGTGDEKKVIIFLSLERYDDDSDDNNGSDNSDSDDSE
jgi:hypothetical protein